MMHYCFQKTEKGREEIATRRYGLSLRLRSILLLIDGKRSADDLLHAYPGLGLTESLLQDLQAQGFICTEAEAQPSTANTVVHSETGSTKAADQQPAPAPDPSPASELSPCLFIADEKLAADSPSDDSMLSAGHREVKRPAVAKPLAEQPTLFEAIKSCYQHGLRHLPPAAAAPLLRSLGNAQTIRALAELRSEYLYALRASKGDQAAAQQEQELELLLLAAES